MTQTHKIAGPAFAKTCDNATALPAQNFSTLAGPFDDGVLDLEPELEADWEPRMPSAFPTKLGGPEATSELLMGLAALKLGTARLGFAPSLILSGGGGKFAVQLAEHFNHAVVVHSDRDVMELAKSRVLGSQSAVHKHLRDTSRDPNVIRTVEIRPGIKYRCAPLDKTGLRNASFPFVLIEQGHVGDLAKIIQEALRLVAPGGIVALLSYMPLQAISKSKPKTDRMAVAKINAELLEWFGDSFAKYLTTDERLMLESFRSLHFPFEEMTPPTEYSSPTFRRLAMRETWTLHEVIEEIGRWPVLRRLEASSSAISVWNFRAALRKAWGSPKKRRVVTMPIVMRVGRANGEIALNSKEA